jgi:hypothetical protein
VANLALVQTLHIGDTLDRESVVTLVEASSAGVKYRWTFLEVRPNGDTTRSARERFVSAADLDTSSRLYEVYEPKGPLEHPGYTAFTIGGALYEGIRTSGSGAFSMLSFAEDDPARSFAGAFGFGGSQPALVRWRGTLTRQSTKDEPFPLLINGQRVMVPSLHLKADLTSRGEHWAPEIWILAQHDHPLLLKLSDAKRVFQTVRADLVELPTRSGVLEGALGERVSSRAAGDLLRVQQRGTRAGVRQRDCVARRRAEAPWRLGGHDRRTYRQHRRREVEPAALRATRRGGASAPHQRGYRRGAAQSHGLRRNPPARNEYDDRKDAREIGESSSRVNAASQGDDSMTHLGPIRLTFLAFAFVLARPVAQATTSIRVCVIPDRSLHLSSGAPCPAGQASYNLALDGALPHAPRRGQDGLRQINELKKTVDFLKTRVSNLEHELANEANAKDHLSQKVIAPFEVVDKSGRMIFRVRDDRHGFEMANTAGQTVLWGSALDGGGVFKTRKRVGVP